MTDEQKIELLETVVHFKKRVTGGQIDQIYNVYRRLLNPKASGCATCASQVRHAHQSCVQLYEKLKLKLADGKTEV